MIVYVANFYAKIFCHVSEEVAGTYTVHHLVLVAFVFVAVSKTEGKFCVDVMMQGIQFVFDGHAVFPDLSFHAFLPVFIAHVGGPVGGHVDVPGMDGLVVVLCQYFD